ncbi:hypothetical protein [Chroococcidiopsis sp. CCNUC1]|uniref:hypothetical protein n=1 Tax=Chroococcidiopsis sp. CCNUC1 TaxID=2653189 RepID=UPI0020222067|nr:hypothetical protein [Chroococcidiopsis sp. CCNUC1]URD53913.1 hypothetical protein M5J74_31125 [Chroococcidiopsis sp. CCNUC1]
MVAQALILEVGKSPQTAQQLRQARLQQLRLSAQTHYAIALGRSLKRLKGGLG